MSTDRFGSNPPPPPSPVMGVPRQRRAAQVALDASAPTPRREVVGRRLFVVFPPVLIGVALCAILLVDGVPGAVLRFVVGLSCAATALVGVVLYRPRVATPWLLLSVGEMCWTLSGIFSSIETVTGRVITVPVGGAQFTAAALASLAGYVPLAAALREFGRSRWGGAARGSLDGLIVGLGLGLLCYVAAMAPVLSTHHSAAVKFVLLAPTVADLMLLAALTRLLSSISNAGLALGMTATATGLLLVADTLVAAAHLAGHPDPIPARILWLITIVLVAVAPLHPSMRSAMDAATREHLTLSPMRLTMLAVALLSPPAAVVFELTVGRHVTVWPVVAVSLGLGALVTARAAQILRGIQVQAAQLAGLAATDYLTGLPNRRSADAAVAGIAHEVRSHRPGDLVVVMMDLDRFKSFNDRRGHASGDRLLAEAAESWRRHLATFNGEVMISRYGGEEFLLVARGVPRAAILELVETLRDLTPFRQTFSAGVARWDGTESLPDLIQRADAALYSAKAAGRARTVEYADPPPRQDSVTRDTNTSHRV